MTTDLITISVTLFLGIWLTTVYTALKNMSWGSIRRLEKELVLKAEAWMGMRNEYRILLRLLVFFNLSVMAVSLYNLAEPLLQTWGASDLSMRVPLILVGAYLFVLATEALSAWLAGWPWWILRVSMPIINTFYYAFYLAIFPAIHVHRRLERLRDKEEDDEKTTTEEEIEALLEHEARSRDGEEDEKSGLEESTGKMIRGVLDLGETLVKEIMTPRVDVIGVEIGSSPQEVRRRIVESGHSRIPVYRSNIDDIVGIIYAKNMLDDEHIHEGTKIEEVMHHPVYIPETKNVDELLQEFRQSKVHLAVVIDEYGGTAGIVCLEDIIEEIVGEIVDEFDDADDEDFQLEKREDGSLAVEGRTPIEDVYDALELELSEDEDNVTIGGYILSRLGRIPKSGESVVLDNLVAEVLEADERRIERLILRLPKPEEQSED